MRIVGLVIVLGLFLLGVMNGGALSNVIDTPSVLIVVGLTLGLCLQSRIPFVIVFMSFFGKEYKGEELRAVVQGWKQVRTYVMVSGVLGTFVGMINMFNALDVYDAFLPGTATALITTLYAAVLSYMVFLPLQHQLEKQLDNA